MWIPLSNGRGAANTPKRCNDQDSATAARRSRCSRAAYGAIGVAGDGDCTCRASGHGTRVNEPSHGNASPRGTKIGSVLQRWPRASAVDPAVCRSQSLLFFANCGLRFFCVAAIDGGAVGSSRFIEPHCPGYRSADSARRAIHARIRWSSVGHARRNQIDRSQIVRKQCGGYFGRRRPKLFTRALASSLRGRRPCETGVSCTAADTRLGITFP